MWDSMTHCVSEWITIVRNCYYNSYIFRDSNTKEQPRLVKSKLSLDIEYYLSQNFYLHIQFCCLTLPESLCRALVHGVDNAGTV